MIPAPIQHRLGRLLFRLRCADIVETAPIRFARDSGFALLSQLQHKDVLMYLLAVKSFCRRLTPAAVYVLSDGSLTNNDFAVLERHMPGISFLRLEDYRSADCPGGGTWERLLAISEKVAYSYVIQLDADTLSCGPLTDVSDCIRAGRAFTIATWDNQRPESARERWGVASGLARRGRVHVQVLAEAHLDRLRDFDTLRYIRGCSGFAGFPRGSFSRADVEGLSRQMALALGPRWDEWGTEQFTSNLIVANTASPTVLPHPKYCDCTQFRNGAVFVHFIGTCRFSGDLYRNMGHREIAALRGLLSK